jgi:peptidoglycan/xylan/chitin deacetylase (PgdA/CDA1 family)
MQKMRTLKLLVSMAVYIADSSRRVFLRLIHRQTAPSCVVLYYHSVPDEQRRAFADQMNVLARLTVPISVEGIPQLLSGGRYSGVTFDDGFEDVVNNAIPELEKRSIPATVFVTTGYLGGAAHWWPESAPQRRQKIANAEEWKQLRSDLISIGSHTITHPHLPCMAENDARRELHESRAMLQAMLNRDIRTFSFPYGEYNEELIRWCGDAGYERVFTITPANAFRSAGEHVTGRVLVEPTDWRLEFRLKLLGAYRWLPYAMSWKRKLLASSPFCGDSKPITISPTRAR